MNQTLLIRICRHFDIQEKNTTNNAEPHCNQNILTDISICAVLSPRTSNRLFQTRQIWKHTNSSCDCCTLFIGQCTRALCRTDCKPHYVNNETDMPEYVNICKIVEEHGYFFFALHFRIKPKRSKAREGPRRASKRTFSFSFDTFCLVNIAQERFK